MIKIIILMLLLTFLIVSGLGDFLENLSSSPDSYDSKPQNKYADAKYMDSNSYGDKTLCLDGLDEDSKKKIWKDSFLNKEMLELFPRFIKMQELVETRLIDNGDFKKELIQKIVSMEKDYIGGSKSERSVKMALSEF